MSHLLLRVALSAGRSGVEHGDITQMADRCLKTFAFHCLPTKLASSLPTIRTEQFEMALKLLTELPNEIITQIILQLSPEEITSLDLVSKQFRNLTLQPTLWQQFTRARYTYWDERWPNPGQPGEKPARPGFDWKDTYVQRRKIDRSVNQQINSILSSQAGRIEKSAAIVDFGYHAKDELVRNTNIHDDAEDVLARRFVDIIRQYEQVVDCQSKVL